MQVGKPKTTGEEVDEEVGREVDGGRAIEGQGRREHRKAWGKSEERNGGRRGKKTWTDLCGGRKWVSKRNMTVSAEEEEEESGKQEETLSGPRFERRLASSRDLQGEDI